MVLLLLWWFKEVKVKVKEEGLSKFAWGTIHEEEEDDGEELCKERKWSHV